MVGEERKKERRSLKRAAKADGEQTEEEGASRTPAKSHEERYKAEEGISLHGKHPLQIYPSRRHPNTLFMFSFKSLNHTDVTYKCSRCETTKRALKTAGKNLVIPTIRVRSGYFLSDPDELDHFCLGGEGPEGPDCAEQVKMKQIVL